MYAHAEQRGPGLWDEVCSPKMQWWSLLALGDLFVINRPHTRPTASACGGLPGSKPVRAPASRPALIH